MNVFSKSELINFICETSRLMEEKKDYLIELDAAMGDGDLGLTMTARFWQSQRICLLQ
jgi:phosphoenolpyruvate---glycerone phosphotransferase subunit DhaL